MGRARKAVPFRQEPRDLLLHLCITAIAAGALVVAGHWFGSRRGRCIGGGKRGSSRAAKNAGAEDHGLDNQTSSNFARPMSLAELRVRRLKAAEARLCSPRKGPSAVTFTPLGRILNLADMADKLEEETQSLLKSVASAKALDRTEEKEQVRLLELFTQLQIEVDSVPSDESVRPHRKHQTNRIQTLIASLDQLKRGGTAPGIEVPEAGSNLKE